LNRVHVLIEPIEEKIELSAQQQAELWREWTEKGPQGPIPDKDAVRSALLQSSVSKVSDA